MSIEIRQVIECGREDGRRKGRRVSVEEKIQILREAEVAQLPPAKIVDMTQALT